MPHSATSCGRIIASGCRRRLSPTELSSSAVQEPSSGVGNWIPSSKVRLSQHRCRPRVEALGRPHCIGTSACQAEQRVGARQAPEVVSIELGAHCQVLDAREGLFRARCDDSL